jgi:uncharacterized membrane protein YqjE
MSDQAVSVPTLIREVVGDARRLINDEIALARAEVREQTAEAKTVGMLFGAAALLGLVGVVLLAVAIGAAISDFFNWPLWIGNAVVAVVAAAGAFLFFGQGRSHAAEIQVLPKTKASLRENIAWIQSKSSIK